MPYTEKVMVASGVPFTPDEEHPYPPNPEEVEFETIPSGGGSSFDPNTLPVSTNTPADANEIITSESGTWYRKAFSKVWDYIKSKIGIADSGDTYLKKDGTWGTPTNTNDAVTQTISSTENADYRVLLSGTADDTTRTEGARKDTDLKYNPSTNLLTVGKVSGLPIIPVDPATTPTENGAIWITTT